jgi:hypothetical protein
MPDNVNWFIDDAGLPAYADPAGKVYRPADLTPVPTPDEEPADPAAPVAPAVAPGSSGQSSGYSVSGSNTKKVEKAKKGQGTYEEQQIAAAKADESAIVDPMAQNTQNQINLVGQEGDIAAQQAQAGVDANLKQAELQRQFAAEEQAAQGVADTQIKKAHAAYLSQVQAYSAMNVNPGQLWGNLSGGNRAQALAAVFASDFLGARGIHTSAMDSLNRAIDENISAQVANINKQGQVAEHFKDLYNMTVGESASDLEARTRMRGFYLAASDKEIQAELAKYDAPMARIKAQEASAALADNFYKSVVIPMYKLTTDRVNDAVRTHMSQTVAEIQAAAERYSADQATQRTQMGIDAANAKGPPPPKQGEPFVDYNGKVVGVVRPGLPDKTLTDLADKQANMGNLVSQVGELKDLIRKYGAQYGGDWMSQLKPEEQRDIEALANNIAYKAQYATDHRFAQSAADAFKKQFPIETWSMNGGVDKILSRRIIEAYRTYKAYQANVVRNPQTPEEQAAMQAYQPSDADLGPYVSEAQVDMEHPFDDLNNATYQQEFKAATGPDAGDALPNGIADPTNAVLGKEQGVTPAAVWKEWRSTDNGKTVVDENKGDNVPKWANHLTHMVIDATDEDLPHVKEMLESYVKEQEHKARGGNTAAYDRANFVKDALLKDIDARTGAKVAPAGGTQAYDGKQGKYVFVPAGQPLPDPNGEADPDYKFVPPVETDDGADAEPDDDADEGGGE